MFQHKFPPLKKQQQHIFTKTKCSTPQNTNNIFCKTNVQVIAGRSFPSRSKKSFKLIAIRWTHANRWFQTRGQFHFRRSLFYFRGGARDIPETYRRHAGDMPGHAGVMPGSCRGHAGVIPETCRRHAGVMPGSCRAPANTSCSSYSRGPAK